MILVIDNYDSFTYNLVQYFGMLGESVRVFRNDSLDVARIGALKPKAIVISPGPGGPSEAGISCRAIETYGTRLPVLGVCLGHQCIASVYGGRVVQAHKLMHGKTSSVYHDGKGVFVKMRSPVRATRYHSLIVERESLPSCLQVSAWTREREIMGVRHRRLPVHGVQFHPESVMTEEGMTLLKNFLELI